MNLELNLVKTQSIYSKVSSLIKRKRVVVEDESNAMMAIADFIVDNISIFESAIHDKDLIEKLRDLHRLTITDFTCLKYVLASNGLDLIVTAVAEQEVNETEIPKDLIEYNIVDSLNAPTHFIKFTTKIPLSTKSHITELYKKLIEIYGLFEGELFNETKSPLEAQIRLIGHAEEILGVIPTSTTMVLNSIVEFLGKDIYAILEDNTFEKISTITK